MAAMRPTRRRSRKTAQSAPKITMADVFKARLGYQNTAEKRRCVRCFEMLPDSDFDTSFTPADPLINRCRGCESRPQESSSVVDSFNFRFENR